MALQFISAFNVNALGGGLIGTVVHVECTDECYRLGCIGEHGVKKREPEESEEAVFET